MKKYMKQYNNTTPEKLAGTGNDGANRARLAVERSLKGLEQDKRGIKHPSSDVDLQWVRRLEHPVKVF
jgi:hypothetical protein